MPIISPTITASEPHEYRSQIEQVESFAKRIHIDLMDGIFTPNKSVDLSQVWWPEAITADIHLMYQRPLENIQQLIKLKPNLVIVHFEADLNHEDFTEQLHEQGIKAGLAILQDTKVDELSRTLNYYDHVLVFSGHLGYHGGHADLSHIDKVSEIRKLFPKIEISWDGGINSENAKALVDAGVDILNIGGFIQKSSNPEESYKKIQTALK